MQSETHKTRKPFLNKTDRNNHFELVVVWLRRADIPLRTAPKKKLHETRSEFAAAILFWSSTTNPPNSKKSHAPT